MQCTSVTYSGNFVWQIVLWIYTFQSPANTACKSLFIDIYLFCIFGLPYIAPVLQVDNIEQCSVVIISMYIQDMLGSGCS